MNTQSFIKAFINLLIIILVLLLLTPIFTIVSYVFQPSGEVWQHLIDTVLADYVLNSLFLTVGVAVIAGVLGISTAWFTSMYRFPGHKFLPLLLMLPMAMPAYIIAFTYTGMLDSGGMVQTKIRDVTGLSYGEYWFPDIRNIYGAMVMLGFVLYPYVFLMARASFLTQSSHALQVGQTLGLNSRQRFFKIALPLSRPAIIASLALVIMETLADYGTVQYFGVNTFTTGIFRTWYGLDDLQAASNLSAMLLVFVLIIFGVEAFSRRKIKYTASTKSAKSMAKTTPSQKKQYLLLLWCLFPAVIGFVIPALQLAIWAWGNLGAVDKEFMILCWNSFYLAFITAIIAVFIAFMIYSFQRYFYQNSSHNGQPSLVRNLLRNGFKLVSLGYAIPGIVVAIGILIPAGFINKYANQISMLLFDKQVGLVVGGSVGIVIFAYLVRFMAVALSNIESGFGKISPSIDDAGKSLNTKFFGMMFFIHMPMLYKGLLTAVLIIFVDVLKELPTTLILRPFNFNTLAVNAFELASDEFLQEAALPSVCIILTGLIPVILLNRSIAK